MRAELAHEAPRPKASHHIAFGGPLQWALEGHGWTATRRLADVLLLYVAVVVAVGGLHAATHPGSLNAPLLALPLLVVAAFQLRGVYRSRLRASLLDGVVPMLSGVTVAAMAVAVIGTFANGTVPEQSDWLRAWLFSCIAVVLAHGSLAYAQRRARTTGLVGKPVIIVGAGMVGARVARRLIAHPEYGLAPVGFLDEDPRSLAEVGGRDVPVLGTLDDLEPAVKQTGVSELIVAFSSVTDARISRLVQRGQELGLDVSVVPRMFDTINGSVRYDTVGGLPLMSFRGVDPYGLRFALKHALDRVLALILLLALSPLLILIALAVRLSSPGPAMFKQRRVGRDGKIFDFYKYRSMRTDQGAELLEREGESSALDFLLAGDIAPGGVEGRDRRTAIGRLLRASSFDELPQLFNVLRGDMSLVGPRPERPEFVELFREDVDRYGDRHRVKSGMTGWAQVHGLRGQTSLAERVEWDNYYIANWSLGLDLKILALTFAALLRNAD